MRRVQICNRPGTILFEYLVETNGEAPLRRTQVKTAHEAEAATKIGISVAELAFVDKAFKNARTVDPCVTELWVTLPEVVPPPTRIEVRVRGLHTPKNEGQEYDSNDPAEAFRASLQAVGPQAETNIEWEDVKALAALDVDFHGVPNDCRPSLAEAKTFLPSMTPQPFAFWSTHHRGLRGMYAATDGWRADELAAAAVFSVRTRWPEASFEIKKATRHPAYPHADGSKAGPVWDGAGGVDLVALRIALQADDTAVDKADVTAWLAERGLEIGKRYTHEHCPFAPSSRGANDPVQVFATGVHCFYCRSQGVRDHASFASLTRGLAASLVATCVRNWTHWEHARHAVEQTLGLSGDVAKLCYRVALKIAHGIKDDDDARLAGVFDPANELLRFDGFWTNRHGEPLVKKIGPLLAALPACKVRVEEKKRKKKGDEDSDEKAWVLKVSPARVALFDQSASLDEHGYTAIQPIWGARIATVHQPFQDSRRLNVVFYPPELRACNKTLRPQYVPENARGSVDAAWRLIEGPCPRVPRAYVELLVAAKGCAEVAKSMPPVVFASGPSGAAKTGAIRLAAAICGDQYTDVVWSPVAERFRQSAMEAAAQGTYCAVNEATKLGRGEKKSALEVMDAILNFTERSSSHKLYVGSVAFGRLPVFVFTDTVLPDEVQSDKQLARRLVWVPLSSQVDWEDSLIAHGVAKAERLRVCGKDFADACDVILSDVIDRFFREPIPFTKIAEQLGYSTAQASRAATSAAELGGFFRAVCRSGGREIPPHGKGWVVIEPHVETEVKNLWVTLTDPGTMHTASRRCEAEDWGRMLGVSSPVKFEVRKHGSGVAVRFTSGRLLNGGIIASPVQLGSRPDADSVNRPGNAVGGGLADLRIEGVPETPFHTAIVPSGEGEWK